MMMIDCDDDDDDDGSDDDGSDDDDDDADDDDGSDDDDFSYLNKNHYYDDRLIMQLIAIAKLLISDIMITSISTIFKLSHNIIIFFFIKFIIY